MKLTREQFDEICQKTDKQMKKNQGHSFETMLKTRCQYCGRSPKAKGHCRHWFQTWINMMFYNLQGVEETSVEISS